MEFIHRLKAYQLALTGLGLITLALLLDHQAADFHLFTKLLSEVGVLLLIVGVLHWMFEHGLRQALLKDVLSTILAGNRILENGLIDCHADSNKVESDDEIAQWKQAKTLIIGVHYAKGLFQALVEIFRQRCQDKKETVILLLNPESHGTTYLRNSDKEVPDIAIPVNEIIQMLTNPQHVGENTEHIKFFLHHCVLRYSFIATEEYIWISLFFNSKGMSHIPAFKIKAKSPLYESFWGDIQRLRDQSQEFLGRVTN